MTSVHESISDDDYFDNTENQSGWRQESIPLRHQTSLSLNGTEPVSLQQPGVEIEHLQSLGTDQPRARNEDEPNTDAKEIYLSKSPARALPRRLLGLCLLTLYAIITLTSWCLTCVLCSHPIGIPGYTTLWDPSQYQRSSTWQRAASVGSSIATAIGIPITSAICARAAAVYCQRKSNSRKPSLTLRQMMVMADKGWSSIDILWNMFRAQTTSPLLVVSAFLVGIALLIPILQSALLSVQHIKVLTTDDIQSAQSLVSTARTPEDIAGYSLNKSGAFIIDNTMAATLVNSLHTKQSNLWPIHQNNMNVSSLVGDSYARPSNADLSDLGRRYFTSSLPVGTDTGLLRNLALRINSSVGCDSMPQSAFPSTCPGTGALSQTFTNINASDPKNVSANLVYQTFRVRLCAPSFTATSPWQATTDRQDITEDFWLDVQYTQQPSYPGEFGQDPWAGFTQHCYGNSTIGYFELPNYLNGHVAGELMQNIDKDEDYYNIGDVTMPLASGKNYEDSSGYILGPFLLGVLSVFGSGSFFDIAASHSNYSDSEQMFCQTLRQPFIGLNQDTNFWKFSGDMTCNNGNPGDDAYPLLTALLSWLPNFSDPVMATAALTVATSAANTVILSTFDSNRGDRHSYVWSTPGSDYQKPNMPVAAMVIISLLVAIHILGLATLAIYASLHPSWTESLDAFAMLLLGAEIGRDLPAISAIESSRVRLLDCTPGWIGSVGSSEEKEDRVGELVLGGAEMVQNGKAYRCSRRNDGSGPEDEAGEEERLQI